ncbi:MAG: UvrD-helicase domain-containing protein [Candidatus Borkfalkiaceae bacterium]|nr:UvrD-helicase domain-containing protein [Clostridia bacterium]MDY6223399.1 UvrD-helicase domain-containing protein [Christensenellaceae bacterium]
MNGERKTDNCIRLLDPKKNADKEWFLSLLDDEKQRVYEEERLKATLILLRAYKINPLKKKIAEADEELAELRGKQSKTAETYCRIKELGAEKIRLAEEIEKCRPFFNEPYFARMDLVDDKEGYNSYYIGKRGDMRLEIVDWRAPIARRYYQKSSVRFSFNEYDYKVILRRALRVKEGKTEGFRNEFLSVRDYLSREEIAGRDEEILFDPYLREILKSRKEELNVRDIIETIQEKQYEVISLPEKENFVLQGCAGSGKTMVMLHRLSYLMYNDDALHPRDVLLITPGDSFNEFIERLSEILQLQKVRAMTVGEYFAKALSRAGIETEGKIDFSAKESEEYLKYLYSPAFLRDIQKKISKVYGDLHGVFTGEECREYVGALVLRTQEQIDAYERIKNASLRIRRAVLGEIKEKKDGGGVYYTKPFRYLMNAVTVVNDFLKNVANAKESRVPAYFFKQLLSFYKNAAYLARKTEDICAEALISLTELAAAVEKELADVKRYRQTIGGRETYVYPERLAAKQELLAEVKKVSERVKTIGEKNDAFAEFYAFLRGESYFSALGKGENFTDVMRYFYRETVKKTKLKFGMDSRKLYQSDRYALCALLAETGEELRPAYSFVFVDEAQDISAGEFALLRKINARAAFNVFGDLEQNVTPYRGVGSWENAFGPIPVYKLNNNYRNTNQIVEYVQNDVQADMRAFGVDGPPVERISARRIASFFAEKKGLKAVICSEKDKEEYMRKSYWDVGKKGRVSRTKVNILTVYESKGLEFSCVAAAVKNMSKAERYIACTRALKDLAIVE